MRSPSFNLSSENGLILTYSRQSYRRTNVLIFEFGVPCMVLAEIHYRFHNIILLEHLTHNFQIFKKTFQN